MKRKPKFTQREFTMENILDEFNNNNRVASIVIMKITGSSFDNHSNKFFINALICDKKRIHSEVVFLLSPKTLQFLMNHLKKIMDKSNEFKQK